MEKYKNLYRWMIIPMIIMQAGIFMDYWGDFSDNAWAVHVHYWTGTAWYFYLIIQPYYATHGKLDQHRTNGMIGMFLAGAVCLTALSMMHRDIVSAESAAAMPERFGPFKPWFFYGVIVLEIVMMVAFAYAVFKSIIHRKELENHAWWLISTVFIIMMPALGRGLLVVNIGVNTDKWPDIDLMPPMIATEAIIITLLMLSAWKYGKLKHAATWLAVAVNVFNLLYEPIGKSETVQVFIKSLIKG